MAPQSWWAYQGARARALGKRRLGPRGRALIWNWEFSHGQWEYLEDAADPPLTAVVSQQLGQGRLLDLGCGNGITRVELVDRGLTRYVGVDISREAVGRTRARASALAPLAGGEDLVVGDITDPRVHAAAGRPFDVILIREVIYYVPVADLGVLVGALGRLLDPSGVMVVRIHNRDRYAEHVARLRSLPVEVVERPDAAGLATTLVLRSAASSG